MGESRYRRFMPAPYVRKLYFRKVTLTPLIVHRLEPFDRKREQLATLTVRNAVGLSQAERSGGLNGRTVSGRSARRISFSRSMRAT